MAGGGGSTAEEEEEGMEDCSWTRRNLLTAGNGAAQTAKSETRKDNECSPEFSSGTAMLALIPGGLPDCSVM